MSNPEVRIGGKPYAMNTIREVLAGYAFGSEPCRFDPERREPVGEQPTMTEIPRWAYQSYDCIPTTFGPLTPLDVLVTNGLNGQLDAKAFHSIMAVAPEVDDALMHIPLDRSFWSFDRGEIEAPPSTGSDAWWMWRAWWLLRGTPNVGIALTHKVLHHKRPTVFPLLDNKTRDQLQENLHTENLWLSIYDQLVAASDEFTELEAWFADFTADRGGISLTRLRIHDILLWCDATDQIEDARVQGRELLGNAH